MRKIFTQKSQQASIEFKMNNGSSYSRSLSNASMVELVKTLKEKLQIVGLVTQIETSWSKTDDFVGTFSATQGDATITYKQNTLLSDRQIRRLNLVFSDEFG